jgi:predicted nucleotidyltransferase
VKGSKDLRIWTNNPAVARETLWSRGIPSVEKLQFIDEFPRVTERLVGDASSHETISAIVDAFQSLPPK